MIGGGGGGMGLSLSAPSQATGGTAAADGGSVYMLNLGGGAQSGTGRSSNLALWIAAAIIAAGLFWVLRRYL